MNRTISLRLTTAPEQSEALTSIATAFSDACNAIVPFVVENRCWNRVALHHFSYYAVRDDLPALGSQMVCNAIGRVSGSYMTLKSNKGIPKNKPVPTISFRPTSVDYDKRTYTLKPDDRLSLFTLSGRITVPFKMGTRQRELLTAGTPMSAKLIVRKGVWYFNLVIALPDAELSTATGVMGVDVGENVLCATDTGKVLGGGKLRHRRDKYLAHRRRLQANGSHAARRKLRAISGREERHVRHVNHVVSKQVVEEALKTGVGEIRMEDLTNIRARIKAGRRVRTRLHRWAFRQLQDFVAYKGDGAGINVVYVRPEYTSQTCCVCGELGTRRGSLFHCHSCGTRLHADVNGACNIAGFAEPIGSARGAVSRPVFTHRTRSVAVKSPAL